MTVMGLRRLTTVFASTLSLVAGVGCASPGKGTLEGDAGPADASAAPASVDGADDGTRTVDAALGDGAARPGSDAADGNAMGVVEAGHDDADRGEGGLPGAVCPLGPFPSDPIPSGATPTQVAGVPPSDAFNNTLNNFTTVEGPVWIGDALYVSEFPGNPNPPPSRILKVGSSSGVSVAVAASGSNGLAVDRNGNLFGAVHQDGSISRFDLSSGARVAIATTYMGTRFNSPNDLAIRSDGTIYFSDPDYQAPSPRPQTATRVYRIAPGTGAVSVVDSTLTQPNGVTLSLDESTLFVSSNNGIHKYPVLTDGSTGPGTVFPQSPNMSLNVDGMAIDCAGNLYGAVIGTGNVVVLSPSGAQVGTLLTVTNMANVTNVAFGGSDHKTLYVTAQGSSGHQGLFQVRLSIPGMPY
jgi:gluconolactonase